MSDIIISVENLSKRYLIGHQSGRELRYIALRDVIAREARNFARKAADFCRGRQIVQGDEVEEFWALRNVSFEIKRGQVLGIIGRNGAGKSTLLKILSRITEPTEGRARLRGRVASLLEIGTGFHPELTGRENIFLNGAVLGMVKADIRKKFDEIVAFGEVEKFLDMPVKQYSSGMYVRLAFAVAAHLEPEILLVDEVLSVGDIEFQRKCLGKLGDVAMGGRTVIFVSHNMAAVQSLTSRGIVLSNGEAVFDGNTQDAIDMYLQAAKIGAERYRTSTRGIHTKIEKVCLIDKCGGPTSYYTPGEPLRIELTVSTDGAPSISLEIFLIGPMGQKLAMASLHQFHGHTLPKIAGVYRAVLELNPMWIASGTYSLDVATSIVNSTWDHYIEASVSFEVPYSNCGGKAWDFQQHFGYGAFAMGCMNVPLFQPIARQSNSQNHTEKFEVVPK
jgi:lipopolysaccharide transport system ATP-binding protein